MALKNDYLPGSCNIGPAEIRRRVRAGWAGAALTAIACAGLLIADVEPAWHLVLFLPALAAAIGFVQARNRFCVYFGFAALFNFSDLGQQAKIVDRDARQRDRAQAWRLLAVSVLIASAFSIAAFGVAGLIG